MKNYRKQVGFSFQFTGEIIRFVLPNFAIQESLQQHQVVTRGPTQPTLLTFSVNGTGVPSKNPWFSV